MRFLVVEDEELVARALRKVLAPFGEVSLAMTVKEAETLLASGAEWSAFFIDIGLPDGSGMAVLAQARGAHPETPAMVLTGKLDAEAINTAFDLEAEYVLKPVRRSRIANFLLLRSDFPTKLRREVESWRAKYSLSDAEADVLERAAKGESRESIAASRGCSLLTVKAHVANLIGKTRDASLHDAASRLLRAIAGCSPAD